MAVVTPTAKTQFIDAAGAPLAGGKLYTYIAGTTTPQASYTDSTGATPNSNPVILDSRGEANVWLGESTYKFKLTDANDVEIWTVDYISAPTTALSPVLSGNVTISTDSAGPALKITQTGTGDVLRVQDSVDPDVTPFIINAAGYVGIGTAAPANALDVVNGTIQVSASTGEARTLIATDSSNSYLTAESDRALVLKTNDTARIYASSAGVGIGTSTPTAALDVVGAIKSTGAFTGGGNLSITGSISATTTVAAGTAITAGTTITTGTTLYADTITEKTTSAGTTINGVICKNSQVDPSNRVITASATVATNTSASYYDFTDIPSWVRRITLILRGVSLSQPTPSDVLVQLGTSGGLATTGYLSTTVGLPGATSYFSSTSGMLMFAQNATYILSGSMVINLLSSSSHSYVSAHTCKLNANGIITGGGDVALSGVLTQLRLGTNGTGVFTAGTACITYE